MKKIIAILLSVVLIFSIGTAAYAVSETDACDCGNVPVIFVTGFASTPLIADKGLETERSVFGPEAGPLIVGIVKLMPAVFMLVLCGNEDYFATAVCTFANDLFGEMYCDDSGNPVYDNISTQDWEEPTDCHDKDTQHKFYYDWRRDVFDIAAELNDYIEEIKALTGHSKVALRSESMGGAVTMTYLSVYGHDSIDTIVMQSSAFNGITLMGDIFTGDLKIESESILNYIKNFVVGDSQTMILARVLISYCNFLMNPVAGFVDQTLSDTKEQLFDGAIRDMIGNFAGLWTFVPQESYEEAKNFMLDETENAELIRKIDRYHYGVMDRTKELLDSAMADGMKLAIISNYGKAGVPVGTDVNFQSDFLIDTARTSHGATCSTIDGTLGDGYVQAIADGHNHLSCDGQIDASTCLYPEQTWFIKDMLHTGYTAGYDEFVYQFIYDSEQQTVWSRSDYPQFLYNNAESETLEPLTTDNCDTRNENFDLPAFIGSLTK